MSITLALSLWMATVAGVLAYRARVSVPRVQRRLAHLERYGLGRHAEMASGGQTAPMRPDARALTTTLGRRIASRLGADYPASIRSELVAAGHFDEEPETFIGLQAVTTLGAFLLSLLLVGSAGSSAVMSIALVGFATYAGFVGPRAVLSRRARSRLAAIDREMPEVVDLLVVAIEAGLGLFAALDHATTRLKGPLRDELRLVLREQSLGASSAEALSRLADRCDTPGVRSFARTLVQGERLGVSIGNSMRALALEMRKRRKAEAEEQAQKMPLKILFPLVLCIFPAMFVVLLAPAVLKIVDTL